MGRALSVRAKNKREPGKESPRSIKKRAAARYRRRRSQGGNGTLLRSSSERPLRFRRPGRGGGEEREKLNNLLPQLSFLVEECNKG